MVDKTNYVRGNAIFLYDSLQRENTAEMIGDLAHMVNKMPFASNYDYNTPIVYIRGYFDNYATE